VAAEREGASDVLRRAIGANVQYYAAIGKLTVEYLQALAALTDDAVVPRGGRFPTGMDGHEPASPPSPRPAAVSPQPAAIVLEAGQDGTATGLFMVENALAEKVSAPIAASAFRAEDGREVTPKLAFEPEVVTLEPGEQMLVRVSATIDHALEPDLGYRGELSVPGVAGTRVPLVLRRRPSSAA
jgi:hypothetical protein